jgi:hypothetical protein
MSRRSYERSCASKDNDGNICPPARQPAPYHTRRAGEWRLSADHFAFASRAISVVITTHNRANMVGVAIASVLQSASVNSDTCLVETVNEPSLLGVAMNFSDKERYRKALEDIVRSAKTSGYQRRWHPAWRRSGTSVDSRRQGQGIREGGANCGGRSAGE